jgi:TRAP-type C4-dicarboxylate transport system permease small subunit
MGVMSGRERLLAVADRVQRAQLWVAVAALVTLMMVTVFDVFLRYLFNRPIESHDMVETMLLVLSSTEWRRRSSAGATS